MRSRETGPARPASQSGPMNPILRGSLDACLTTLVAAVSIAASTLIVAFPWVPLLLHSLLLGRYALYMWGGVGVVLLLLAMWRFFRLRSPEPQLERMKIRDCRFEAENPEGARDYMLDKYGVDGGPGDDWVPGCVSRVLPRQPMSVQKGLRLPLIRHNRRKERLEFRPGVCVIPHDSKAATGGEDAHFWSKQMDVIGVADGVSSISQYGIDPKQFSTQLMARCRRIAEERWDAKSHAERERERERGRGSAKGTHQNENNTRKDKGEGSEVLSSCCATSAAGNAMTSPEKEEGDGTVCVAAATGKPEEEEGGERKAKEETGDSGETSLDGEGEGTQMEKGKEKVKEHERENNLAGSPGSKGSEKDKETGSEKDPQLMVAQRALQILYSGYRSIRSAGINGASTAAVAVLDSERNFLGVVNLGDSGLLLLRRGPHGVFRVVVRTVDLQHRFNCPYQLSNILGQEGDSVESSDVLVCHVQEGDLVVVGTDGLFDNVADAEIAQVVSRAVSPIEAVRLRVLASATLRGMNAEAAEAGVKAAASVVAVSGWPPSTPKAGPGGNAAGSGPLPLPQAHPDGKAGEGHLKEDENGGVEEKEKAGTSQVDVSPSSFRTVEEEGSTKNQSPSNSPKAGGNSADSPDGSGEEGGRGQESGCPSGEVLKEGGELTESQRSLAQAPYYSSEHDLASKSLESASSSSSGPMLEDQEGQQRASENDENEKGGGTLGVSRAGKEKEKNVSADLQKEDKDRREKFERRLSDAQKEIGGEIPRNLEATHPKKIAQALAEFAYERSHSCRAMTPFTERCLKEGIRWEGGKPDDITVLCSWIVRRAEGDPALLEAREGGGEPADIPVPQQNAVGIHRNEPAPWRGLTAQGGGARVGSGGGGGGGGLLSQRAVEV
uniref:PPM-type phosphatase domain-containing protein n=1 Tax=Chromera velia CCMP2878 TaxID=1169474 RepID=A0A0G4I7L8_9ALVE